MRSHSCLSAAFVAQLFLLTALAPCPAWCTDTCASCYVPMASSKGLKTAAGSPLPQ